MGMWCYNVNVIHYCFTCVWACIRRDKNKRWFTDVGFAASMSEGYLRPCAVGTYVIPVGSSYTEVQLRSVVN